MQLRRKGKPHLLRADSTVADDLDRVVCWGGVGKGGEREGEGREGRGALPGSACCAPHLRGSGGWRRAMGE